MAQRPDVFRSRMLLVLLGLCLGYIARSILGPPTSEMEPSDRFPPPGTVKADQSEFVPNLPLGQDVQRGG